MIRATTSYVRGDKTFKTIFTIFKPDFKEKSLRANISTSRKCDATYDEKLISNKIAKEYKGEYYVSSYWNAIFIGEAFNKAKKYELKEYDKITDIVGELTNEPYINDSGERVYNNPTFKIQSFEFVEPKQTSTNLDTPPKAVSVNLNDLPF